MEFTLLETIIRLVVETNDGETTGPAEFRIDVNDFANVNPDAEFLARILRKCADELDLTNPYIQREEDEFAPPQLSLVEAAEGLPQ